MKRISLDEIESHEFLNENFVIPKLLPSCTLSCPPNISYLRNIMPNNEYDEEMKKNNFKRISPPVVLRNLMNLNERRASESNNIESKLNKQINENNAPSTNRNLSLDKVKIQQNLMIPIESKEKQIFIENYVDYSTKYGIGKIIFKIINLTIQNRLLS